MNADDPLPSSSDLGLGQTVRGEAPASDDLGLGKTVREFVAGQILFGRYKLKRFLGRGGMGVVWLAHDEQLERDVAIKFLPDMVAADPEAIADLKRETRRSLELTHPHIVRIHDLVQDGTCACISMEYVDGKTLSALKVEQPGLCFSVETVTPWVRQLLEALDYAHTRARVVHRDLKPANLMINGVGELKVADFGIAKSLSDSVSRMTLRVGTSGTLVYMSPQQAQGRTPVASDDIYSLGATLYDLLSGKPPFYSGNIQHQLETIVPDAIAARRAELGNTGTAIPARWEKTIAACLAKEPQRRPASVREVAKQLGIPIAAGVETAPPGDALGIGSSVPPSAGGKSKMMLVAVAVVALIALGSLGYYFGVMVPAEKERQAEIAKQEAIQKEKELEAQQAADAVEKARLEAEANKAAADAEALRTQQEKAKEEADRLAAARGGVIVKTDPPGATVTIGGEDVQMSPATFKSLKLGKYPIHITLDGYEPVEQEVEVKENDFADLGTINLVRSKGTLAITTDPGGLDYSVSQNGIAMGSGKTPVTLPNLPMGNYDVSVKKGDWEIKNSVTVQRNETTSYAPEFATGSLSITSTPSGATVTYDGKEAGKTPCVLNDLKAGGGQVNLSLTGYAPKTAPFSVVAHQTSKVDATLDKPSYAAFLGKWTLLARGNTNETYFTMDGETTETDDKYTESSIEFFITDGGKLDARMKVKYSTVTKSKVIPGADHTTWEIPGEDVASGIYNGTTATTRSSHESISVEYLADKNILKWTHSWHDDQNRGTLVDYFGLDSTGQKLVQFEPKDIDSGDEVPQIIRKRIAVDGREREFTINGTLYHSTGPTYFVRF